MSTWLKVFLVMVVGLLGASVLWVWAAPLTGSVGRNVVFTETNTIDIGGFVKANILALHQQSVDPTPIAGDWLLYAKSTGPQVRDPGGTIYGLLSGGGGGSGTGFIVARVATTENIVLTAGEQTIDGVLTSGSIVLVKNQTTPSQNGLYTSSASLSWARLASFDISAEFANGMSVYVMDGTTITGNKDTVWHFAPPVAGFTLNTTAITFVKTGPGPTGELLANRDTNSGYPQLRSDAKLKHTQIGSFAQHTALALSGATPITVTARQMGIEGNGGQVNLTAVPQIVAGANGDEVELIGTHLTNTVQLDQGDGVYLCEGVGSIVIGLNGAKPIFRYSSTLAAWEQIGCIGRTYYGATNLASAFRSCDTPNGNCLNLYGSTLRGTAAGADIDSIVNIPATKNYILQGNGVEFERMTAAGVHSYSNAGKPRKPVVFKAIALEPDGTNCTAHAPVTANSGPKESLFKCADSNSSMFFGSIPMLDSAWDGGAVRFTLTFYHQNTETLTYAGDFSAQCKAPNETVDNTWSSPTAADVSITTAHQFPRATTTDITPVGTCSGDDVIFWRYVVDAANFSTNAANAWVYAVTMTYLQGTRNGDN